MVTRDFSQFFHVFEGNVLRFFLQFSEFKNALYLSTAHIKNGNQFLVTSSKISEVIVTQNQFCVTITCVILNQF